MSTKKSKTTPAKPPAKPASKSAPKKAAKKPRQPRVYSRDDFKKLTPSELEKLGYSKKSERFVDKKTGENISKREFTKRFFQITPEARAKAIRSGARPILDNASKQARLQRITKASEKRATKNAGKTTRTTNKPISMRRIRDGQIRYDYKLPYLELKDAMSGQLEAQIKIGARLQSIFNNHAPNSLLRPVVTYIDVKGELQAFSLPLYVTDEGGEWVQENMLEKLKELLARYLITMNENGFQLFLKIYGP